MTFRTDDIGLIVKCMVEVDRVENKIVHGVTHSETTFKPQVLRGTRSDYSVQKEPLSI